MNPQRCHTNPLLNVCEKIKTDKVQQSFDTPQQKCTLFLLSF